MHQSHCLQSCNGCLQIVIECVHVLNPTYKLQRACSALVCMVACLTAKLLQPAANLCGTQTVALATTGEMQIKMLYTSSYTIAHPPQQNVFVLFLQAHILLKSSSGSTLFTMASTSTEPHLMKAVVIRRPGGPDVLKIERLPVPKPHSGQVLIRVKAFGLNRSELFTRQGHSPGVPFPRVLGIEAVGLVEDAPGKEFEKGATVATAMGGMGRQFDGGYAEYTCVPATQVQVGFSFIC